LRHRQVQIQPGTHRAGVKLLDEPQYQTCDALAQPGGFGRRLLRSGGYESYLVLPR
jgi:hypothetical protein